MPRLNNNKNEDDSGRKKKSIQTILKQALTPNSQPTEATFPELFNVLCWFRALLAVGLGYGLGARHITGAAVMMQCLHVLCFVPTIYVYLYLGVKNSSDHFGGMWKILWTNVAPAMALCVLVWTYMTTAALEIEMELLNGMLVTNHTESAVTSDGDRIDAPDTADLDEF